MNTDIHVAILTDYLLHPESGDFLPFAENLSLIRFAEFLRQNCGWKVDIFQASPQRERRFRDFRILGFDTGCDRLGMYPGLNDMFAREGLKYDLCVYYHWNLTFPLLCPRSIVVSHGVFWDAPSAAQSRLHAVDREEWLRRLLFGIAAPQAFVAEDRNTVNVIRAIWPGYDHRLAYIPPGIDLSRFRPAESPQAAGSVRVICPQDFAYEQGVKDILALCRAMAGAEPPVEFHIVGHAREFAQALQLAAEVRTHPNCRFYWCPAATADRLYPAFDFALLPSRGTEGASFYALQAMACGLPIVAGLAGGLAELVVDDWNGRLIMPHFENTLEAVRQLASSPGLRRRMSQNARLMAEGYPIAAWKQNWLNLLNRVMTDTPERGEFNVLST